MGSRSVKLVAVFLFALAAVIANAKGGGTVVPRVWDDAELASSTVPLAERAFSAMHVRSQYYYGIPVRPIYKSYPVYAPGKEPPGYVKWLEQQEPQQTFDPARLKTPQDWVRAGKLVFEAPIVYGALFPPASDRLYVRDPAWYRQTGAPVARDGTLPFYRYVVRTKGKVEIGLISCAMCHRRVMPNGSVVEGAQGNFPFDRAFAYDSRAGVEDVAFVRTVERTLFAMPWSKSDPCAETDRMSKEEIATAHDAIPPGVAARHGTSPFVPAQVPDLIGVRDRKYLDRTGLMRHRGVADMMRYAALNQDGDFLARHGGFMPQEAFGKLPDDPATFDSGRYSDEQLYALAMYLYSLEPPPNPHRFDALAARGRRVFEREGCAVCHAPPLYTNNMLTPVDGFVVPKEHLEKYDILPVSVGTDPRLALDTRRGTGYYKVPSLRGVWYRGPFEHSGSVATLEDWFDPRRLGEDYVPTGFRGPGVKARAVRGHAFGLDLSPADRKALVAFLRTL